uniref:Uncharacterized protein n=1 Tax=Aegilops tauschii subsp. strangulata TaxID=200361 RepID=A0A453E8Q7_AEGTS
MCARRFRLLAGPRLIELPLHALLPPLCRHPTVSTSVPAEYMGAAAAAGDKDTHGNRHSLRHACGLAYAYYIRCSGASGATSKNTFF